MRLKLIVLTLVACLFGAGGVVAQQASYGDIAHFLAGQPVSQTSPLYPVSMRPSVQRQAGKLQNMTAEMKNRRLNRISEWARGVIHPKISRPKYVKYPFGGPDFVHVVTLFPGADEYVLVGLEPLGSVPDFTRMPEAQLDAYLGQLNYSMRSISRRNFFLTKEMREDLSGKGIEGVFPLLLFFAAITDHEVLNASYVTLNGSGQVNQSGAGGANGIWLQVRAKRWMTGFPEASSIYYFKTDLSNSGFKAGSSFNNFLKKRPGGMLYLKAASYLMHTDSFSNIRNYLASDCQWVLQDASGFPAAFLAKYYNVYYFGNYVGPIDMFSEFDQPDLRAIYQSGNASPLPFGTGYRMSDADSVQMFGVKK